MKASLISEFGTDFFSAQETYVRSWLSQVGMVVFDDTETSSVSGARPSNDLTAETTNLAGTAADASFAGPDTHSTSTFSTKTMSRAKSIRGRALSNVFHKDTSVRCLSSWFKEKVKNLKHKLMMY